MPAPMKLMIALEFGSTGAEEMSLFQRLSAGNGTNPFRLALCPRLIPLQALACVPPFTVRLMADELLAPGLGLLTLTANDPDAVWLPEAVNCVALTNVVVNATPARLTCAPLTKLLPVMATVKLPAFIVEGEMLLRIGVGLSSVTAALALAAELAALVAATVRVFGFGRLGGAT